LCSLRRKVLRRWQLLTFDKRLMAFQAARRHSHE
jgi:hypothetical protein